MTETILTPKQLDVLHAIGFEQVTWHAPAGRGTTYRLWDSETTYKVVTRLVQRIPENLFTRQMAPGFTYIQRGYCELTPEGRRVLTEDRER